ncbi:MAG: hypothetical protein AMXMBFR47_17670 [Planctomycetota bacterium]
MSSSETSLAAAPRPVSTSAPGVPAPPSERRLLVAVAGALAFLLWGQFLQPHGDFYEFRESGLALIRGEIPPSLKRSPAWPLAINLVARALPWHWLTDIPAEQAAAQTLNGLLLVGIAIAFHRLAARWAPRPAPWLTLLLLATPTLWWAAAGTLLEPLLILLVLVTCERSAADGRGRYLAAAGALLVRPDCAGLLLGVAAADLLRRRPWPGVLLRSCAAAAPAAAWLALTLLLWRTHSRDHYLTHLRFDIDACLAALDRVFDCAAGGRRFLAALELSEPAQWLTLVLPPALAILALTGAVALVRRGRLAELAALLGFAGAYFAGVAAFRFTADRYYLPLAAIVLALAAPGAAVLLTLVRSRRSSLFVTAGLTALLALFLSAEVGWWSTFHPRDARTAYGILSAIVAGPILLGVLRRSPPPEREAGVAPPPAREPKGQTRRRVGKRPVIVLLFLLLGSSGARQLPYLFAEHDAVPPLVAAARWTREHLPPPARVLSGVGGLLALHAGENSARFPGLEEIEAAQWSDILAECRAGGIEYILWYADFYAEQGEFYIRQWRLDRFKRLDDELPPEIERIHEFPGERPVWIGRIRPPGELPAPAAK